jgi:hypothetical protein
MNRRLTGLAFVLLSGCTGHNVVSAGFAVSNGVTWQPGSGAGQTTTLAGNCSVFGSTGHIECDGLVVRVATPGVFNGIGWQELPASQTNCAGTANPAPKIAVFSFGSLVVVPSATVNVVSDEGGPTATSDAIAFVASDRIEVDGTIVAQHSGPPIGLPQSQTDPVLGISPGVWAAPGMAPGASGAGGVTAGGAGGVGGPAGGAAVVAQFEPMCFGSMGGWVGSGSSQTGGEVSGFGGTGGGAVLLAAANGIDITGSIVADGLPGAAMALDSSGPGGGSGGTILLEAPTISASGSISARGGNGGNGADSVGGAGGGTDLPGDGGGGDRGGGGGGSAGFIRVRTSSCASTWPTIVPAPACETLTAGD